MHVKLWSISLKGSDHLEDLSVDGRTVLRRVHMEMGSESVDWIDMIRDTDQGTFGFHIRRVIS